MAPPTARRAATLLPLAIATAAVSGFAPSAFLPSLPASSSSRPRAAPPRRRAPTAVGSSDAASSSSDYLADLSGDSCLLTPEGYGFSATAQRILDECGRRGGGYHPAKADDKVIDVMEAISDEAGPDVALVFEEGPDAGKLLGIFTEADYIDFSVNRAKRAKSEEESASFLLSPISRFLTPTEDLVTVSPAETANVVIRRMKLDDVRHILVSPDATPENRLASPSSDVTGVVSMQDVMSLVQRDERLSLSTLIAKYPGVSDPVEMMRMEIKSTANELARDPVVAKTDVVRVGASALFAAAVATFFTQSAWLGAHAPEAIVGIFVLGYVGIIFEEVFEFNKAAIALLMSTGMWVTYADFYDGSPGVASQTVLAQLGEQLAEVSDICFFLLAASTIVEVVDAHQGFKTITNNITTKSKKTLFWIIGFLTFFLSSILNNLTVTIVMVSLLRKLIPNETDRRLFGAMVVVAANAGGVWTPIGDVTTTMLWINDNLSTVSTITQLFLPSIVCLVTSLFFLVGQVEEDGSLENSAIAEPSSLAPRGKLVFGAGLACLLAVPIFSEFTGLPPYIAMLTGLGAMWTLTDVIHMGEDGDEGLKVPTALSKLDTSGILFFLGILMSIGVLDKSGLLKQLAVFLNESLPSLDIISTVIGLASALIDNVPLVAATMGMYDVAEYGTDDRLWQLIALCAGTGGSILIIGSASGVALMGLEKVDFLWYAKNVSFGAAVGYFAGIATYIAQDAVLSGSLFGGAGAESVLAHANDVVHGLASFV